MVSTPDQWPHWFVKGWTEAVIEWSHSAVARSGKASIIFCTSLPAELSTEEVDQFKDGVKYVFGDDVQFLIEVA